MSAQRRKRVNFFYVYIAATIVFFVILSFLLTGLNAIGLADNHDFWRLTDPFGLKPAQSVEPFKFLALVYNKGINEGIQVWSSGLIFVGLGYVINGLLSGQLFYVPILGLIYAAFYALGFFFLLRNFHFRSFFAALIFSIISIILLLDYVFIVYFNSFYQEAAFLVTFLLFVALYIAQEDFFIPELVLLTLAALSKIANIPLLVLFYLLYSKYRPLKATLLVSSIIIALTLIVGVTFYNQGIDSKPNIFNSFFKGLVDQNNSTQVLANFSLALPEYQLLLGKDFWSDAQLLQKVESDFFSKVRMFDIVKYYITHPVLFNERVKIAISSLMNYPRPNNLGNFSASYKPELTLAYNYFSLWEYTFPLTIPLGIIGGWLQLVWILYQKKYQERIASLLLLFPCLLLLQVVVAFLGDGFHDFAKHNVPFYFTFTLFILLSCQFWYKQYAVRKI